MAKNIFNSIPLRKPRRNIFDLSFDNLVTLNFGDLVPIMCKEVLPGDTWQVQSSAMVRFGALIAPIMHRVNVYIHYFFVPSRILWSDFEDFITGGRDGESSAAMPRLLLPNHSTAETISGIYPYLSPGSLWDYLGLPTTNRRVTESEWDSSFYGLSISLLPFAAYQKIYQDYYRDQNLEEEEDIKDIIDANTFLLPNVRFQTFQKLFTLRTRAWEKDYFTSALPWPQRGGDVHLPLSGDAPILGEGSVEYDYSTPFEPAKVVGPIGFSHDISLRSSSSSANDYNLLTTTPRLTTSSFDVGIDNSDQLKVNPEGMYVDTSNVTSATVNELRRALRLQEWLEKNARSGARYIEQILSHFGVRSSDGRLDRAEYLGGGKSPVQISEVLQTSATTDDGPLADMAGHGISVGNSNKFRKFFEEHGYVIGIMSVIPRSSYAGGIPKHFTKFDKFDFAWPEFANLGEQEIMASELCAYGTRDDQTGESIDHVFGYTPRYAEYKFSNNEVHGDFLTNLSYWHLARLFLTSDELPHLSNDFIKVRPTEDDLNRIFAVTDNDTRHLMCEVYNRITVKRTLPKFGVPTL